MNRLALLCTLAALSPAFPLRSQEKKPLEDIELTGDWITGDLDKAFAAAGKSGKPLLVVFR